MKSIQGEDERIEHVIYPHEPIIAEDDGIEAKNDTLGKDNDGDSCPEAVVSDERDTYLGKKIEKTTYK
jgi:hypothetical protein